MAWEITRGASESYNLYDALVAYNSEWATPTEAPATITTQSFTPNFFAIYLGAYADDPDTDLSVALYFNSTEHVFKVKETLLDGSFSWSIIDITETGLANNPNAILVSASDASTSVEMRSYLDTDGNYNENNTYYFYNGTEIREVTNFTPTATFGSITIQLFTANNEAVYLGVFDADPDIDENSRIYFNSQTFVFRLTTDGGNTWVPTNITNVALANNPNAVFVPPSDANTSAEIRDYLEIDGNYNENNTYYFYNGTEIREVADFIPATIYAPLENYTLGDNTPSELSLLDNIISGTLPITNYTLNAIKFSVDIDGETKIIKIPVNFVKIQLGTPSNLVSDILLAGGERVDLAWDSVSLALQYQVEYKVATETEWIVVNRQNKEATTESISGLVNNVSYDFRVRAVGKTYINSGYASIQATPALPTITSDLMLSVVNEKVVATASFTGVSFFWELFYRQSGESTWNLATSGNFETNTYELSYTFENEHSFLYGVSYEVRLRLTKAGYQTYDETETITHYLDDLTTDSLSLVRGVETEFDISAVASGRSEWTLSSSAPDIASVSDAGILTINPTHSNADVGQLTVNTTQGTIFVPTTIRDGFPNDFFTPRHFWSLLRAYNGAADTNLFQVKYRRYDSDGTETLDADDNPIIDYVDVQSGAGGYTNITQLQTDLSALSQNGFVELYKLYNQRNATNFHFTAPSNRELFMGVVKGGILDIYLENDSLPYAKSYYTENDLNTETAINNLSKVNTTVPTVGSNQLCVSSDLISLNNNYLNNIQLTTKDFVKITSGNVETSFLPITALTTFSTYTRINLTVPSSITSLSVGSNVTLTILQGTFPNVDGNNGAAFSSGSGWIFSQPAFVGVLRRYRHADNALKFGDGNYYPGIKNSGSNSIRMDTSGSDSSVQLSNDFAENWFYVDGHLINEGSGIVNRISIFELESENSVIGNGVAKTGGANAYAPIKLELGAYDFAEAAIYEPGSNGAEWQSNKDIVNNLVGLFGNTHEY